MATIANYGLLWGRDNIFWGSGGKGWKGHLKGYKSKQNSIVADFREQVGVYVLLNADLRPVYVGKAGFGKSDLFARLKAHDIDHLAARWKYFSWFGAYKVSAKKVPSESTRFLVHAKPTKWLKPAQLTAGIREIEAVLIQVVEPSLNKRGSDWIDAEEFHQVVDERLEVNSLTAVAANQRELLRAFAKLEANLKKK